MWKKGIFYFVLGVVMTAGVIFVFFPERVAPRRQPSSSAGSQTPLDFPSDMPRVGEEPITLVPDHVKGKWKAVTLVVEDRENRSRTEHTINLGEELALPDSALVIKVGDFLPDLIVQGSVITSLTNDPKNPAIYIRVMEGETEIFKGWLFSLSPTIHPFRHKRFGITLKEAIAT